LFILEQTILLMQHLFGTTMNKKVYNSPTIQMTIYMSGDINKAEDIIRKYCLDVGFCVTIECCKFIYSGGEEFGFKIGILNYPRFPSTEEELTEKSIALCNLLHDNLYQWSSLLVTPQATMFFTTREKNE